MNDTTDHPATQLLWAGKSVPMDQVEKELALLWKLSTDTMRTDQHIQVRTSILNLVICVPDVASAYYASNILRGLSSIHLARVVIAILDQSTPSSSTSTWVTLRCFPVISDIRRHCFEQITMIATGSAIDSLSTIIQPLLKPDLPVYLRWVGELPGNKTILRRLADMSHRLIVDSTSFVNPDQDIPTLASLLQELPDCAFSDLNWSRIHPLLQLIAQFFDTVEYRQYLAGVNHIDIEHVVVPMAHPEQNTGNNTSPNPSQALLLAAWLKTCLGWTMTAKGTSRQLDGTNGIYQWQMTSTDKPRIINALLSSKEHIDFPSTAQLVTLAIHPQIQAHMYPGSISLIRLLSHVQDTQAIFTIDRDDDPEHVLTSIELPQQQEKRLQRTVHLTSAQDESELLRDELEITGHDRLFAAILQEAAELLL